MAECCLIKYEQRKEFGVLVVATEKGTKLTKNVCLGPLKNSILLFAMAFACGETIEQGPISRQR